MTTKNYVFIQPPPTSIPHIILELDILRLHMDFLLVFYPVTAMLLLEFKLLHLRLIFCLTPWSLPMSKVWGKGFPQLLLPHLILSLLLGYVKGKKKNTTLNLKNLCYLFILTNHIWSVSCLKSVSQVGGGGWVTHFSQT